MTREDATVDEDATVSADKERPGAKRKTRDRRLYPHAHRKECETCRIMRPPLRSHHCRVNGRCVATFDHHCAFLDTCVGERNHFRFWLFLWLNLVCLRAALGVVGSARPLTTRREGWVDEAALIIFLAKLYMYPIYLGVALLWITHTFLAVANVTTFEATKGPEHIEYLRGTRMFDFPFGEGLCRNLYVFFARDNASELIARLVAFVDRRRVHPTKGEMDVWKPMPWKMPAYIERDSEDWWNHPWQNKYWSCC